MKAIVTTAYGSADVLQLIEIEKLKPKDTEVLIKNYATAVSSGDWKLRKAEPFIIRLFFGLLRPKKTVFGYVLSGEIEEVGEQVSQFKKGDKVYATTGMELGAYAEYVCLPEQAVMALKPDNLSYEEAASIPFGGNTALYFLRKANLQQGQRVLIYGASGAVGTAAVQLAKHYGAQVTGVCSTSNVELVKSLGADEVTDYTCENFAKSGKQYDVIFDTVGMSVYGDCMNSLTPNGILLLAAAGPSEMLKGVWTSLTSSKKVVSGVMSETADDLVFFKQLIESGKFIPVIDKSYPLEQIADAHRYVEKGHKKGNVAITIK